MRRPIKPSVRFRVLERDNFTCRYCGSVPPHVVLHVDHVLPVAEGGSNDESNLVAACFDCNIGKGTMVVRAVPDEAAQEAMASKYSEQILDALRHRFGNLSSITRGDVENAVLEIVFSNQNGVLLLLDLAWRCLSVDDWVRLSSLLVYEQMHIDLGARR